MKPGAEERFAIHDLYAEASAALDEARFDDWLDCFVEDCCYRIVPRENIDANLPLALVLCDSKDMLRDRIVALTQANEYNLHSDRHLVSNLRFRGAADGVLNVHADFAVFQIDTEGHAHLFAVGTYQDEVVFESGSPKFRTRTAIMDNSCVPHALSTPL